MSEAPLINILIRTSNRPQLFKRCVRSVLRQSHKNVKIIVSYDTISKPSYVPDDLASISVFSKKPFFVNGDKYCFYNLYCNDLKDQVTEGFFMFLDDDDYIQDAKALEYVSHHLKENHALIVQMSRMRKAKPINSDIISGKIGMPCIILHHKWKHLANFDASSNADYKFIKEVTDKIPYRFIPVVVAECGKRSKGKI